MDMIMLLFSVPHHILSHGDCRNKCLEVMERSRSQDRSTLCSAAYSMWPKNSRRIYCSAKIPSISFFHETLGVPIVRARASLVSEPR
jgi:hypothetical protein